MERNSTNEKIRNILTADIKFLIGLAVFVAGVVAPYYQMKTDIALIKQDIANINQNHEVHIQDLTQQIKDINISQSVQNDQIIKLQEQLIKISR